MLFHEFSTSSRIENAIADSTTYGIAPQLKAVGKPLSSHTNIWATFQNSIKKKKSSSKKTVFENSGSFSITFQVQFHRLCQSDLIFGFSFASHVNFSFQFRSPMMLWSPIKNPIEMYSFEQKNIRKRIWYPIFSSRF